MMKPIVYIPSFRARAVNLQPLRRRHHHHHQPLPIAPVPISRHARRFATSSSASSGVGSGGGGGVGGGNASSSSKRRAVTPFNDTGHVPWSSLSIAEKAGRAAQQSFNLGLILVGVLLTGSVAYFLYTDVFSRDSKTAHFNRAVDRIRSDPRCTAVLGPGKELLAHGDETYNKWRRARPIQSTTNTDRYGNEHFIMHFYVEGPKNRGLAMLHLVKKPTTGGDFEYKYFYIDVPGHERIYLENADTVASGKSGKDKKFKFLGVTWTQ